MTNFIPADAVATVPVSFLDSLGRPVAAPASVTFNQASPNVDSLSFDGATLTITPTADGSDSVSVAGLGGEPLTFTVGAPIAVTAVFGTLTLAVKA